MARRKVKEVKEESSVNEEGKNSKKRPKASEAAPQRQTKKRVIESKVNDNELEPIKEEPARRAKSARLSSKIITEHKKVSSVPNGESVPKALPVPKKKSMQRKSKREEKSETEPKLKKAKVVLHRLGQDCVIESEHSSLNSVDSGISAEPLLEKEKCSSSVKTKPANSSKNLDSSGFGGEASSSESEWEEVEENKEIDLDDYKPEIPKEGVEITIDCPDLKIRRRKKKQFDEMDYIRLYINRLRKESQLNVHKTHLLCLIAHGFYVNNVLNSPVLKGIALSLIPSDIFALTSGKKIDKVDVGGIENIVRWFRSTFSFENSKDSFLNISKSMIGYFENQNALNASEYNLMFIVLARTLGFKTRFCISLYALTHKAQNLIKKSSFKKREPSSDIKAEATIDAEAVAGPSKPKAPKEKVIKKEPKEKKKVKKVPERKAKSDSLNTADVKKRSRPRRSTEKSYKLSSDEDDEDKDDDDYVASEEDLKEQRPGRKYSVKTPKQKANRKVLSSDSTPSSPEISSFKSDKVICWAEVFSKPDKQWISVECVNNLINKPYDIERVALQPVTYIVAYDNESYVKDVTRRYCSDYMISTVKLRPDSEWWEETLEPFSPPNSKLDKDEEKHLETLLVNKPLPNTIAGFKNHPLYALKRHLLKFEAIYPPDAAPVGFFRKEPVYARECVCQLHSRETWLKEARVVRIGEDPYKIVKARPKWDRLTGTVKTDIPLNIFGFWQTEPYKPPVASNGKVPRNEYGNVELFKPCMLPKGTVHLQLPGLNRIAKKLGIDCSAAVVGFDGHKGAVHAVFDGFIICKEFKDTIIAAWEEEQVNAQKREEEKREKRIYGNWKKLIKGLLIRERIKLKYDTK